MESTAPANQLFPPCPENVPPGLAKPTSKYRLHAWLAFGGLIGFGLIYMGLAAWFGYSAYRLFISAAEGGGLFEFIEAFGSAIIAIFLVKGMFFKKRAGSDGGFEITAEDQPVLFDFIHKVADETSAPRPHKVYLSATVNACVFYDLSLLNFFFPTKKNLEIGLGLVNVLTLSEFKAVLAHEFGHFAQKTMAVGRWVYIAQQIANQVIYHRDALDSFLNVISGIDLRIAWIGWVLRLIVWSLRSILDSLLSLIMLAERALSREMEFQADLVAVSTTGSDALIHGLFRLPAADEAWEDAKSFITDQLNDGYKTDDVFAVQSRILEHQKRILDDPDFGSVPALPAEGADKHRIFNADIAQPPQMWATHPLSHFREANAKNVYVPAVLDDRSAWDVFLEPGGLRQKLSAYLFDGMEQKERPIGETISELDQSYDKECYNPHYRGVYLERSICDHAESPDNLYYSEGTCTPNDIYPESLVEDLEKMRNLSKEKAMLVALRDRRLETPDGIIRFRGDIIKRSGLGEAIETSNADLETARNNLVTHDRKCRSYHLGIAQRHPGSWDAYHKGLVALLHFSDHALRDILDANGKLANTYAVVIADGNVSSKELTRLLADAVDLYRSLDKAYESKSKLALDAGVAKRMGVSSWADCFEEKEFKLPLPCQENIGDWLQAVGGWVGVTCAPLGKLRDAALEELLLTEAKLAASVMEPDTLGGAPAPASVNFKYRTLMHGKERDLQKKLNAWDSFQTASGFVPGLARFLVSFTIIASAVYITFPAPWREWLASLFG